MDWKGFFKPDRQEAIIKITILLYIIPLFAICSLGDAACCPYYISLRNLPTSCYVLGWMDIIPILLASLITTTFTQGGVLYFVVSVLYFYLFACILNFLFRKFLKNRYYFVYILLLLLFISTLVLNLLYAPPVPPVDRYPTYKIELTDSFCISGNQAVVFIRNMGTKSFNPSSEITILNATSGTNVAVNWSTADGTALGAGNLEPGKIGRANATCPSGTLCVYRVTMATTGKSYRASVQC